MKDDRIDDFYNSIEKLHRLTNEQKQVLEKNAPKVIYQYRPITEININNIKKNVVWARKASQFNDPYDCLISSAEIDESIRASKKLRIDAAVRCFEEIKKALNECGNDIRDGSAVSCFSKNCDSLLMWSHYADQHRGMCVGYDYRALATSSHENIYPVSYGEKIDLLRKGKGGKRLHASLNLVRKALDWQYEYEWRIIAGMFDPAATGTEVRTPQPVKVVFGSMVNVKDPDIGEFISYLMRKGIKCTRMTLDNSYFKLNEYDI